MSYVQRRFVQRPYMPYIQRGGGIFSSLGDMAKRYILPFFVTAAKTAKSGALKAVKSNATKNIVKNAKKAVESGIYNASNQILQGQNVGDVIKKTSNATRNKITSNIKQELLKKPRNNKRRNKGIISTLNKKQKSNPLI